MGRYVPAHSQIHVGITVALCGDTSSVLQGTVCTNLLLLTANRESLHAQEISLVHSLPWLWCLLAKSYSYVVFTAAEQYNPLYLIFFLFPGILI